MLEAELLCLPAHAVDSDSDHGTVWYCILSLAQNERNMATVGVRQIGL
jgi:hypothetical protein